jgi:tripartite-type tricarboxylate transporter receptor subunit TctC
MRRRYKGRMVTPCLGFSVGGGYDAHGRMVAHFIGRHIPGNPTIVVDNMVGAGSLRLANWLAPLTPKDGTAFGTISRGTGFDPLLGFPGTDFKGVASARPYTRRIPAAMVRACRDWQTGAN